MGQLMSLVGVPPVFWAKSAELIENTTVTLNFRVQGMQKSAQAAENAGLGWKSGAPGDVLIFRGTPSPR
jgi:hypothetical protein